MRSTFDQVFSLYAKLVLKPRFVLFVVVIILSCDVLGLAVVQYQNRLWFFKESSPPRSERDHGT